MIDHVNKAALVKATVDAATATAASVGVLSFLGVTLSNWVLILTITWFLILILKFIHDDLIVWIRKLFAKDVEDDHKENE